MPLLARSFAAVLSLALLICAGPALSAPAQRIQAAEPIDSPGGVHVSIHLHRRSTKRTRTYPGVAATNCAPISVGAAPCGRPAASRRHPRSCAAKRGLPYSTHGRAIRRKLAAEEEEEEAPPRHHRRTRLTPALDGVTIVVDPGHGGMTGLHPSGAVATVKCKRIQEKNLTLAIALKLRRYLRDAGANVLMTRTRDVAVPLRARPALAADNDAALFLSIHVDDCRIPNTASGTTGYYHMRNAEGRMLARLVVDQIHEVSTLPSRGARSDRSLYATGLAVLRHSRVPAALIEVAYLNNRRDRTKLLRPDFQDRVARAMAAGLARFLASSHDRVARAD